jgi:cytochrome c-type biogenesis protein CcmH/NrfG
MERHGEALEAYRAAHRVDPESRAITTGLIETLVRLGRREDADEAVGLAERALATANDDRARFVLAHVCLVYGRTERARREAEILRAKPALDGVSAAELDDLLLRLGE